jgi:hypothetical protein
MMQHVTPDASATKRAQPAAMNDVRTIRRNEPRISGYHLVMVAVGFTRRPEPRSPSTIPAIMETPVTTIGFGTLTSLALATICSASATAQQRPTVPRPAVQTAGIAPPPPPASASGTAPSAAIGMGDAGLVPVVVGNDGRVFADFGFGYERVLRSCSATQTAAAVASSASGVPSYLPQPFTPPAYAPPVYTPPTYSPPSAPSTPHAATAGATAAIAPSPAQAATSTQSVTSERARAACWTTSSQGKIVVIR